MAQILVVDDDVQLCEAVSAILEAEGHSVQSWNRAEDALSALQRRAPDIIVCDIHMEGMTGYDFLAKIRADATTGFIPFIFITGMADRKTMRYGMELGADDFLAKPFSRSELIAAVNTRLRLRTALAEESDKRIEELRKNISLGLPHELRTPLTSILAFSKILAEDHGSLSKEEVTKFAEMMHNAGRRLHRLVENYLVYAQVEMLASDPKGIAELRKEATPIAQKVVRVACRDKATEYGRLDDVQFDIVECALAISQEHLSRLVGEIIDNALKFSASGTPVIVSSSIDGDRCSLRIVDRGRGMSQEQIAAVGAFLQFERKVAEQQGSGMGLTIARRLASLHGGELLIESDLDVGTTVDVRLPVAAS